MKANKEMVVAADRSVIAKHVENIFTNKELYRISVCANFAHTAANGKRYNTQFYNLDAIISIGYRVNSRNLTKTGIQKGTLTAAEQIPIFTGMMALRIRLTEEAKT